MRIENGGPPIVFFELAPAISEPLLPQPRRLPLSSVESHGSEASPALRVLVGPGWEPAGPRAVEASRRAAPLAGGSLHPPGQRPRPDRRRPGGRPARGLRARL